GGAVGSLSCILPPTRTKWERYAGFGKKAAFPPSGTYLIWGTPGRARGAGNWRKSMKYVWLLAVLLAFTSSAVWTTPLQEQEAKAEEKQGEKDESKEDKDKWEEKKDEATKEDAKKEEAKKPEKKQHTVKEEELEISCEATGTFV